MSDAIDSAMVVCLGVLILACLMAGGTAIASVVIYRSTQLAKEVATRRVLGARRSDIVGMFLLESLPGMLVGVIVGSLALLSTGALFDLSGWVGLSYSAALLTGAGIVCGWMAARHAAKTPFSKSGLFASSANADR